MSQGAILPEAPQCFEGGNPKDAGGRRLSGLTLADKSPGEMQILGVSPGRRIGVPLVRFLIVSTRTLC